MTTEKKQCSGIISKYLKCKNNAITGSCFCSIHHKKYILNEAKKPCHIKNRDKDNSYYCMKDIQIVMKNKPIDEAGLLKKIQIFGIGKCFVTHRTNIGKGDHGYAIREYYKHTKCYGIDSDWNCLPVDSSINSNYKIFNFKDGSKIDIGYQKLNDTQLAELKEEHDLGIKPNGYIITRYELYSNYREWYDYLDSRGIIYYFKADEKIIAFEERRISRYLKYCEETYKDMYDTFGNINLETNKQEPEVIKEQQKEEDIDDLTNKFKVVELI